MNTWGYLDEEDEFGPSSERLIHMNQLEEKQTKPSQSATANRKTPFGKLPNAKTATAKPIAHETSIRNKLLQGAKKAEVKRPEPKQPTSVQEKPAVEPQQPANDRNSSTTPTGHSNAIVAPKVPQQPKKPSRPILVSEEAKADNDGMVNTIVNKAGEMNGLPPIIDIMVQDDPLGGKAVSDDFANRLAEKNLEAARRYQEITNPIFRRHANAIRQAEAEQEAKYQRELEAYNQYARTQMENETKAVKNTSNTSIVQEEDKIGNMQAMDLSEDRANELSQTEDHVDPKGFYDEVEFDPDGMGRNSYAALNPIDAQKISTTADQAEKITDELFGSSSHNNEGDAFRHALWSYLSTLEVGPDEAKKFLDAHEITSTNPDNERMMDLFNNDIGRQLALDPRNKGRDPVEVIMEAIQSGKLRLTPFNAPSDPPDDYYE